MKPSASEILRCFVGVPFKIHCLILTRRRQPHNDSATRRSVYPWHRMHTNCCLSTSCRKSCVPEMDLTARAGKGSNTHSDSGARGEELLSVSDRRRKMWLPGLDSNYRQALINGAN